MILLFRIKLLVFVILLLFVHLNGQTKEKSEEQTEDDVELRIDFTSGSVIANQAPKVITELNDITAPFGIEDTVVVDLNELFSDAESGSALSFSAVSLDTSFVNVKIGRFDSVVTATFSSGKRGKAKVILSASDGIKSISDTVSLLVKDAFSLSDTLNDTIVKSGYSILVVNKDIAHIFPVADSGSKEHYSFDVSSSDPSLVRVEKSNISKSIKLEIADSSFGTAEIEVLIIDSDLLTVRDTFKVDVNKSYSRKKYERDIVEFNPGVSIYTGIEYSGALLKLWVKDIFGVALGGYFSWGESGGGAEIQLLLKPALNFPLHPYLMVGGGYHGTTDSRVHNELNLKSEDDLGMGVFRCAGGMEVWIGKSKLHVIGVEGGYTLGKKEYRSLSYSDIGSSTITEKGVVYKMDPLHFRISYSLFLRKL